MRVDRWTVDRDLGTAEVVLEVDHDHGDPLRLKSEEVISHAFHSTSCH
jgi:hypothetical protein